jgi:hypothetical protein
MARGNSKLMNKIEFIFIVIEMVAIIIQIGLSIFQIVDGKKSQKKLENELLKIELENSILEKYLK